MHRLLAGLIAAVVLALAFAGGAAASDDVETRGTCSGGSRLQLRLKEDGGRIEAEAELRSAGRGARWSFVVLHERRLVARVSLRAPLGGGALRLRRTVADWFGTDTVVVRASRTGESCRVRAVL
jgi:hypothetical protein